MLSEDLSIDLRRVRWELVRIQCQVRGLAVLTNAESGEESEPTPVVDCVRQWWENMTERVVLEFQIEATLECLEHGHRERFLFLFVLGALQVARCLICSAMNLWRHGFVDWPRLKDGSCLFWTLIVLLLATLSVVAADYVTESNQKSATETHFYSLVPPPATAYYIPPRCSSTRDGDRELKVNPTRNPTPFPTRYPSESPSESPGVSATEYPTKNPTKRKPTKNPNLYPTRYPSESPSESPVVSATEYPTKNPTKRKPTKRKPTKRKPTKWKPTYQEKVARRKSRDEILVLLNLRPRKTERWINTHTSACEENHNSLSMLYILAY